MGDKKIREVFNVEAERRAYMADKRIGEGRPQLEVFKVLINNIDGENPGNLYGKITVTNGGKSQYVYIQGGDDSEKVKPGGSATLTGPWLTETRISASSDDYIIDVDLYDRDRFPDPSPDDEVSKGKITWNSHNSSNKYDVLLSEEISGKKGMATIFYAVFSNAVQAFVRVRLIDGDGELVPNVYGVVAVSYGGIPGFENHKNHELFRRSSDRAEDVWPSWSIPLDRAFVAVPLDSQLIVHAELTDHDKFPDLSSDDEIAKGFVTFPAQLSGTSEKKKIYGKKGCVEVEVTWNPSDV